MITPFVAKFLRHVATGGFDGVPGNSALGRCVFETTKGPGAQIYKQGLGMIASSWTRRLQEKGYVFAWDNKGHTYVRIKPAGTAALKEYDDAQKQG